MLFLFLLVALLIFLFSVLGYIFLWVRYRKGISASKARLKKVMGLSAVLSLAVCFILPYGMFYGQGKHGEKLHPVEPAESEEIYIPVSRKDQGSVTFSLTPADFNERYNAYVRSKKDDIRKLDLEGIHVKKVEEPDVLTYTIPYRVFEKNFYYPIEPAVIDSADVSIREEIDKDSQKIKALVVTSHTENATTNVFRMHSIFTSYVTLMVCLRALEPAIPADMIQDKLDCHMANQENNIEDCEMTYGNIHITKHYSADKGLSFTITPVS